MEKDELLSMHRATANSSAHLSHHFDELFSRVAAQRVEQEAFLQAVQAMRAKALQDLQRDREAASRSLDDLVHAAGTGLQSAIDGVRSSGAAFEADISLLQQVRSSD